MQKTYRFSKAMCFLFILSYPVLTFAA